MGGVTWWETLGLTVIFLVFCAVVVLDTSNRRLFKRKNKHKK